MFIYVPMASPALESPSEPTPRLRASWPRWVAGILALVFGAATLVEGGHVLFGDAAARAAAGNVVPFVLTFNFIAGFFYVATGLAILAGRGIAIWLARGLAVATVLAFVALGLHIMSGEAFEKRTVAAMTIRSLFWITQALTLPRWLSR